MCRLPKLTCRYLLPAVVILFVTTSCFAQWNTDPLVTTPLAVKPGTQQRPVSIPDGSGGMIVIWQEVAVDDNNFIQNLSANRINSAGNLTWAPLAQGVALTQLTSGTAELLDAIPNGSGGMFLVYNRLNELSEPVGLYVQQYNVNGAPLWGAEGVQVSTYPSPDNEYAFLCPDGAGGVMVSWSEAFSSSSALDPQTYAQRLNAAGQRQWGTAGKAVLSGAPYNFPIGMVSDGAGGAILGILVDVTNSSTINVDVRAQRINSAGDAQWATSGAVLCNQSGLQDAWPDIRRRVVVSDGAGGAIVVWEDYRNDPQNGGGSSPNSDIFAQRVNSAGAPQWTANGVALVAASGEQYDAAAIPDGSGGVVVAWEDYRTNQVSNHGIYIQRIQGNGSAAWTTNGIQLFGGGLRRFAMHASANGQSALVAWTTPGWDVRVQRVNVADGSRPWGAGAGLLAVGRADNQSQATVTHDGGSGALVAWTDMRNGNLDIYGNAIRPDIVTYTFTGNGNWTVAANWQNNLVPPDVLPAGAIIIINPSGTCILNKTQTIAPGGSLQVADGKTLVLQGDLQIGQ